MFDYLAFAVAAQTSPCFYIVLVENKSLGIYGAIPLSGIHALELQAALASAGDGIIDQIPKFAHVLQQDHVFIADITQGDIVQYLWRRGSDLDGVGRSQHIEIAYRQLALVLI